MASPAAPEVVSNASRTADDLPASKQCPETATAQWLLSTDTTTTITTTNPTDEQASGSTPLSATSNENSTQLTTQTMALNSSRPAPTLADYRVPSNLVVRQESQGTSFNVGYYFYLLI